MSYIDRAALLVQISEEQLVQLTDDDKMGVADDAKIAKAIADSEAEVNGYVATRHAVPIAAPVPDLVKALAIDIAIYRLWRRRQRVPADVRTAYDDAVSKLKDIARGTLTLGIDPAPADSTKGSSGEVFGPERVFDRDKMSGF